MGGAGGVWRGFLFYYTSHNDVAHSYTSWEAQNCIPFPQGPTPWRDIHTNVHTWSIHTITQTRITYMYPNSAGASLPAFHIPVAPPVCVAHADNTANRSGHVCSTSLVAGSTTLLTRHLPKLRIRVPQHSPRREHLPSPRRRR